LRVSVDPAPLAEKDLIGNLVELYLYDFTEFMGWDIGEGGRFGYPYLDDYWREPTRFPFVIRVDDRIAGFAMVHEMELDGHPATSMAEFFVMRKYRRQGIGEAAAVMLFERFPGRWHVTQLTDNIVAQRFWRKVIAADTGGAFTETTTDRHVIQTFIVSSPGEGRNLPAGTA